MMLARETKRNDRVQRSPAMSYQRLSGREMRENKLTQNKANEMLYHEVRRVRTRQVVISNKVGT
jgi:hypothetical protein